MSEGNFSRAYETIEDNTDSAIGDSINHAFDIVAEAVKAGEDSCADMCEAFAERDLRKCIIEVHKFLAEEFLNPNELFKDSTKDRKENLKGVTNYNDLESLNTALRKAETKDVSSIYEFRGDMLIKIKKYKEAIVDYEECLEFSDNSANSYKIYNKMAQAAAKMGNYSQAVEQLSLALEMLECAKVNVKDKENFKKIISVTIKKFQLKENKASEISSHLLNLTLGPENPEVPGVCAKVNIESSDLLGRYAVADEDIAPGTIVASGDPTVAILNPDNRSLMYEFCVSCLRPVDRVYPCLTCSSVIFCSPACRSSAGSSFHRYQCQMDLYHFRQEDTEDAFNIFMTLQTLWQKPPSFFFENWSREKVELVGEVDLEYQRFWNMVTHHETRTERSFLKIIIITVFLLRCNRMTSYLLDGDSCRTEARSKDDLMKNLVHIQPEEEFTEDDIFIGQIIGQIFMVQDSNSHPVFRLDCAKGRNQAGLECIGSGVYPVIGAFFNHSCRPNTLRVNIGKTNYLISSSTIKAGEEVADIYSMHFSEINRKGRRDWLNKNFHFICNCLACQEDWSTFDQLETKVRPELRQKLEVVEKCISTALARGDLKAVYDLHLRDVLLLESGSVSPHVLEVSLRNSLQFACWRFMIQQGLRQE